MLDACPLLAGIPPADLRRDCPTARMVAIRHRGTIYRQGEPARAVFCVLEGQVTIARTNAEGAVSARRAPIEEFRRLLVHHPDVSWEFVSLLAKRQRQMERRLEGFAFKRVEARLAETFRELSGGFATRCGQRLWATSAALAAGAGRPRGGEPAGGEHDPQPAARQGRARLQPGIRLRAAHRGHRKPHRILKFRPTVIWRTSRRRPSCQIAACAGLPRTTDRR